MVFSSELCSGRGSADLTFDAVAHDSPALVDTIRQQGKRTTRLFKSTDRSGEMTTIDC